MTFRQKVLVSFSSYNNPHFLQHLMQSIERYDAGYPFDLLIVDNGSTESAQLSLLKNYEKKYDVVYRENLGRAQGGYNHALQKCRKEDIKYQYYFFMHDDSAVLRDNWLKVFVDRINDNSVEAFLPEKVAMLPVGKVGHQAYPWNDKKKYLCNNQQAIGHWMTDLPVTIPDYYQHISDDRVMYSHECIDSFPDIWNLEMWREQQDPNGTPFQVLNEYFIKNFPREDMWIQPKEIYKDAHWNGFQAVCEFMSDIMPMLHGFRSHCLIGDGYEQEKLGWNSFWGLEYVNHYGCHNLFKRLALLFSVPEEDIRNKFKDPMFLQIFDNMVRKETRYVES